jgi:hypothetical protein
MLYNLSAISYSQACQSDLCTRQLLERRNPKFNVKHLPAGIYHLKMANGSGTALPVSVLK